MAIDRKEVITAVAGLPTKESILSDSISTDNVGASIIDPKTGEEQPAQLTKGEYVLDIPSIVGLDALLGGEGTYEGGLVQLEKLHKTLREKGLEILGKEGLGGIGFEGQ